MPTENRCPVVYWLQPLSNLSSYLLRQKRCPHGSIFVPRSDAALAGLEPGRAVRFAERTSEPVKADTSFLMLLFFVRLGCMAVSHSSLAADLSKGWRP